MAKKIRVVVFCSLGLALTHCGGSGKLKRFDRSQATPVILPSGEVAEVKADVDGVLTAGLKSGSNVAQIVNASANSPIKNTSLAFPPGSITIDLDVTIKPGSETLSAQLASEIGLAGDSAVVSGGVPVQIDASQVVTLGAPFVLAMELPASAGLLETNLDNLALIYQHKRQDIGKLESGVVPRSELTVEGNRVLFSSLYFGWFRLVYLSKPLQERKVVADSQVKGSQGLTLIQSSVSLPACGATDVGMTVYVKAEAKFQTCTAEGWQAIDLTGPQGPTGATGPTGSAGTNGMPFGVYSGSTRVGDFLSTMSYQNFGNAMLLRLSDQSLFSIGTQTGVPYRVCASRHCDSYIFSPTFSYPTCWYMSNDCSGGCNVSLPAKNSLNFGATVNGQQQVYRYTNEAELTAAELATIGSAWVIQNDASQTQSCQVTPSPVPSSLRKTTLYTSWPGGAPTLPFALPISIGN